MTNNYYKKSYITSNKQTKRKPKQNKPEYLKLFLGAFFMMLILFILLAVHLFASVDTAIGENDEGQLITLPIHTYLNKNIAVFGSSGSKKSRGFAIPNAMELAQEQLQMAIGRDVSLVITDPKRRAI